jgi:hypothetical protein
VTAAHPEGESKCFSEYDQRLLCQPHVPRAVLASLPFVCSARTGLTRLFAQQFCILPALGVSISQVTSVANECRREAYLQQEHVHLAAQVDKKPSAGQQLLVQQVAHECVTCLVCGPCLSDLLVANANMLRCVSLCVILPRIVVVHSFMVAKSTQYCSHVSELHVQSSFRALCSQPKPTTFPPYDAKDGYGAVDVSEEYGSTAFETGTDELAIAYRDMILSTNFTFLKIDGGYKNSKKVRTVGRDKAFQAIHTFLNEHGQVGETVIALCGVACGGHGRMAPRLDNLSVLYICVLLDILFC